MKNYLFNEAYTFFPKKIFGLDEKYQEQIEIQRLKTQMKFSIDNEYSEWENFINQIKRKKYDVFDYTNFLLSQPSFHLKISIEKEEQFLKTFNLYSSFVIPYFYYSVNIYDNFDKVNTNISINNPKDIDSEIIEFINQFSLQFKKTIIDEKYLNLKIPDISFETVEEGNFTVMNAFFNSNILL